MDAPNPNRKHLYELRETIGIHPWRKRKHPISDALEPDRYWVRGIRNTENGEWAAKPVPKEPSQFAEVRRLNGMPSLTMQKVLGALRKAKLDLSSTSSGYKAWQSEDGSISVSYEFNHWAKERPYLKMLAPAMEALAALNPTQHPDGRIEL